MFSRNDDSIFIFCSIFSGVEKKSKRLRPRGVTETWSDALCPVFEPPTKKSHKSSNRYCSSRKSLVEADEAQSPFLLPSAMKPDSLITDWTLQIPFYRK